MPKTIKQAEKDETAFAAKHLEGKKIVHVRYLGEGHLARDAGPADLGQVDPHHHEVEVERDANEEHAGDEDREGWFPEEREGVEAEQLAERLKGVRNRKADELGLARGTLLANAVLVEVALAAPSNSEALAAMPGMRRWRMDALGDQLLAVIGSK